MSEHDLGFAARCLLRAARAGTLATQQDGHPFASLVTPATAPDGSVLLLLSSLSAHTRHLMAEPRCAVMVCGRQDGPNPQTAPRLTVSGRALREPDPAWRAYWVARHPYAAFYADFADFSVWRLTPAEGHYVAGFAQAHALAAAHLAPPSSAVRAVAEAAPRILAQCNAERAGALARLAQAAGHAGAWRMLAVDPDGVDLMQGDAVIRIGFDGPVADAAGVQAALLRRLQRLEAEKTREGRAAPGPAGVSRWTPR